MGLLIWIIVGAIVGWISGILTGRADKVGCLSSIILGVGGTVLGGLIGSIFYGGLINFVMQPLVIGLIVAVLLLGAGNALLGTVEISEASS